MDTKRSILISLIAFVISPLIASGESPADRKDEPGGIFVAVGYGGRRMSSRDGVHWENIQQWADKAEDDSNNLISIAYGKGKFVCAGGGGWSRDTQAGHILVSTDGAHWRETKKMAFRISPILFENGRFVAGGPDHQFLSSEDAETWTESPKMEMPKEFPGWAFWFRSAVAGNGIFVFTGNANADQRTTWCATTHDGKTIDSFATNLPGVRSLAFGAGTFLLVSKDTLYTSKDGKAWKKETDTPADEFRDVIYTGKEFFLSANKSTYTSADGLAWKPFGKPIPCSLSWSNGSLFLGAGWPGKIFSSTDGLTWTHGEEAKPSLAVNQVVYGKVTAKE